MKKLSLAAVMLSSVFLLASCDSEPPVFFGVQDTITLDDTVTKYDFTKNVYAHDSTDGDVTYAIRASDNIEYGVPGKYTVKYDVTDTKGNTAAAKTTVIINDTTPPELKYSNTEIVIDENDGKGIINWSEYISAYDNVDGDLSEAVKVDDSAVQYGTVGTGYQVYISVSDSAGNSADDVITVSISDTTAPEIHGTPEKILLGSDEIDTYDFLAGVTASDSSDGELTVYLKVDKSAIKTTKEVVYSVTDKSGNTTKIAVPVEIKDTTPPVISGFRKEITFPDSMQQYDFTSILKAVDDTDGDVTDRIEVDISEVEFGVVGEYNVTYRVCDKAGNETVETQTVTISDTSTPEILGAPIILELSYKVDEYDFVTGVTAYDKGDGDLTDKLEINYDNVIYHEVGAESMVTYIVSDSNNGTTTLITNVKIVDDIPPEIKLMKDSFTSDGSRISFRNYAYAVDEIDGNLELTIDDSDVNYTKNGTYTVVFKAEDKSGNTSELSARVKVDLNRSGENIDTSDINTSNLSGNLADAWEHFEAANAYIKKAAELVEKQASSYKNAQLIHEYYTEAAQEYYNAYDELKNDVEYTYLSSLLYKCYESAKSVSDIRVSIFSFTNVYSKAKVGSVFAYIDEAADEYRTITG